MADKVDYCGIAVTRVTPGELIQVIKRIVDQKLTLIASYVHLNTVNLMSACPQIRTILARFDIVIPDGIAVLWSSRLFGTSFRRRDIVTTYELIIPALIPEAISQGWSFFLFGAKPDVVARASENLVRAFPGLRIAGTHHGYIRPGEEMEAMVVRIACAKPTILLVGLGQPRQEEWILRYREQLGARVVFAMGGYFEKLAKNVSVYPNWVKRTQLYWLYRFLTEPKTVWKRYTMGVPLFLWNIFRARLWRGVRSLGIGI